MTRKLFHLYEMGITAAWLSPIFASPQRDLGYDVSDFYTIEPAYGTMTGKREENFHARVVYILF